ncbi:MAG: hypothetical protein GX845_03475 [Erysipelothrix sp.]|nr:hypothetical protein [Erysipelothrix sp.]
MLFRRRKVEEPQYDMEEMRQKLKETEFEKGDTLALIIAALVTIVPFLLVIVSVIIGIIWLIFLR